MKKFRLLVFAVIAMLSVALTAPANAQTLTNEEMALAIKIINDECPQDMGDGMILTSAKIDEANNIVFRVNVNEDDEILNVMNLMADSMVDAFLPTIKEDENMAPVLEYCKAHKSNFIMKMYNKNGKNAEIVFPYQKM